MLVRFALTGRATVDGSGAATVLLNGPPAWYAYDLTTVVLECGLVSAGSRPRADVYRSYVAPSQLLGHSRSADNVTFNAAPGDRLLPGDSLIVVFVNALTGSTATVNVFGDQVPMR